MPDILEIVTATPERCSRRATARDYYEGRHASQLSARQKQYLQVKTGQEFNDNACPVVVDALAERLSVTGFTSDSDELARMAWEWWKANRMDDEQGNVHVSSIRDGDAYLIGSWDAINQRPELRFELAWDGQEGTEVWYGKDRRPVCASKVWAGDDGRYLNIYYANHVDKFKQSEAGWELITTEQWWADALPVIHFRNKPLGYNYGRSELADVIPLQNALNKSIIDLLAAADTTAFRVYTMIGANPGNLDVVPGSWVWMEVPPSEGSINAIPGEDLTKMIEFKDSFMAEIAKVSRTPLSFFQLTRQVASGESLKQQESGLVSRAKNRQVGFGNSWEDAIILAAKIWNAYGTGKTLDVTAHVDTQWLDPETRDDLGHLQELKIKKDMGVPQEVLWSEMGYSRDQIEKFKQTEEYRTRQERETYDLAQAASNGGQMTEAILRRRGASDDEIAAYYRGLPEQ